jgi:hypothetical protein
MKNMMIHISETVKNAANADIYMTKITQMTGVMKNAQYVIAVERNNNSLRCL